MKWNGLEYVMKYIYIFFGRHCLDKISHKQTMEHYDNDKMVCSEGITLTSVDLLRPLNSVYQKVNT